MDVGNFAEALSGSARNFEIHKRMTLEEFKDNVNKSIFRIQERDENVYGRCAEECVELAKEILKGDRKKKTSDEFDENRYHVIEEMADVLWAIGIMMDIYEVTDDMMYDAVRLKAFIGAHPDEDEFDLLHN